MADEALKDDSGKKDKKPAYGGRIYQNPQNKSEVWINCGNFGYDAYWGDYDDVQVHICRSRRVVLDYFSLAD